MLRFYAILASGLALAACASAPTEPQRTADAAERCRTTQKPDGGRSIDCPLWGRTTTTTATTVTTTTTGLNGESRTTTVERTPTGGDA